MQRKLYFFTWLKPIIVVWAGLSASQAFADNTWTYHQEVDRLNNQTYSMTVSPLPDRGLYDQLKLEIVCRDNALQVVVDADSLIASQGRQFEVEYQVDKSPPVTIMMRVFPDSKRRGYTNEQAKTLIDALLLGHDNIFIRVKTMIRDVLSGASPLNGAVEPVQKVLSDCGLSTGAPVNSGDAYKLSDFERDFSQLNTTQQQHVLEKLKTILHEFK